MLILSHSLPSPLASSHQDEAVLCPGSSLSPPLTPRPLWDSELLPCQQPPRNQEQRPRHLARARGQAAWLQEGSSSRACTPDLVPSGNNNGAASMQRTALQTCKPPAGPCPTFTETQRQGRLWPGLGDGQMLEPGRAEERKVEKSKVEGKERGRALETGEPRPPALGQCAPRPSG